LISRQRDGGLVAVQKQRGCNRPLISLEGGAWLGSGFADHQATTN
jgi:hypothetical protein